MGRDFEPFVRPGRDGLVEPEELRVGGDEVEVEDAGRVASPDDGARVVSDGHALEDNPQVGLPQGEHLFDPFCSFRRRHGPTIPDWQGRFNARKMGKRIENRPGFPYSYARAGVAELADARDSKSRPGKPGCGFDSLHRHCLIPLIIRALRQRSETPPNQLRFPGNAVLSRFMTFFQPKVAIKSTEDPSSIDKSTFTSEVN